MPPPFAAGHDLHVSHRYPMASQQIAKSIAKPGPERLQRQRKLTGQLPIIAGFAPRRRITADSSRATGAPRDRCRGDRAQALSCDDAAALLQSLPEK